MSLRHDPKTGEPWLSEETAKFMNPPVYRWWEVAELLEASKEQGVELPKDVLGELEELKTAYEAWKAHK